MTTRTQDQLKRARPGALAVGRVVAMEAIALLAILTCPLIMGVMMFLTMRGMRRGHRPAARSHEDLR